MHPGALLDLTTDLLHAVLRLDAPADGVVSAFFRAHRELGQRDRHVLAETVYQVLRRRLLLEHLAQVGGGKLGAAARERRMAILAWQGDSAALASALSADERQWLAQSERVDRSALPDKLRHNLPDWLASALHGSLPEDEFWALVAALDQPAPLDLRVNLHKSTREVALKTLADVGITATPTPYSPWGLRIDGRPALQRLELFTGGAVEVQDEGSQLLALLTDARRGEMVVDFCAGAGGKTLALGAAMRSSGRLYAFDVSAPRLEALKPRLARSGLSNVHPVRIAHERDDRIRRLAGKIDRVLVDAPWSGLGTLRRNPDLKWRQSPDSVTEMHQRQLAILTSAARLLKPGGRLVYATCSLLREENEAVVEAFEAASMVGLQPLPAADALAHARVNAAEGLFDGRFLRLWPHRHQTDGFFAALWEKN